MPDQNNEIGDVALVVTTYNYARFLADALDSVFAQTVPPSEVVIVDDGSGDDPAAIAARYPQARFVTIPNQGISAARNAGLAMVSARYVQFLDADDVLVPNALALNLECMAANPGAGFIYGAYRLVNADLEPIGGAHLNRIKTQAYHALFSENVVRMHATVLYDREKLVACGGFDETLPRCEDYEMYLRMARQYLVACHPAVVADYRLHGSNMSLEATEMLEWQLKVLDRHRPADDDTVGLAAWEAGRRHWKRAFANFVWTDRGANGTDKWLQRGKMMRVAPRLAPGAALRQFVVRALPTPIVAALRRIRRAKVSPKVGDIDFGDLARIKPLSVGFGYLRGTPIDRYYIEAFIERHKASITGRVLEVSAPGYSQQFGSGITHQDVLNLYPEEGTTIVGDLGQEGLLPSDVFDCIIFTQTLQYIFDPGVALRQMRRSLKPGGVLLATIPYISPIDEDNWSWYWSFTPSAVTRLFKESFGDGNFEVGVFGNAFAATCFIQGIAVEDVSTQSLDPLDPSFPVNITVCARRVD